MISRSAIAIVVATAVTGAGCGTDGPASNSSSASSPIAVTTTPAQVAPTTVSVTTTTSRPVFDFSTANTADGWVVTNDTVMGGASNGELAWADGVLVFTGELSLANGGGFASIRSSGIDPQRAVEWASRTGPRIKVEGDGRTWTVEVRTADNSGGWISSFPTSPGGLTEVELPWASFAPVTRFLEPRTTDQTLDPARIETLAFYLVDGIEGLFRLGVRSIT